MLFALHKYISAPASDLCMIGSPAARASRDARRTGVAAETARTDATNQREALISSSWLPRSCPFRQPTCTLPAPATSTRDAPLSGAFLRRYDARHDRPETC